VLGGLARRAAYVKNLRSQGTPFLMVDSGDLFFDVSATADLERAATKAQLIGQGYRNMGFTTVNVGDLDLLQGVDFLRKEASLGLPLISANLVAAGSQTPIFPPYVIREIAGLRIAFLGLLSSEFRAEVAPVIQKAIEGKAQIRGPIETAKEFVPKLRSQADILILLADLSFFREREVAKEAPGLHFILGGFDGGGPGKSYREGETSFLHSYAKGMYISKLQGTVKNPASPFQDRGEGSRLQEQVNQLEMRIQQFKNMREKQPPQYIDSNIDRLNQQKAAVQEDLKRSKELMAKSNPYLWTAISMDATLTEDKEIQETITKAGIEKD
jgi:2',3'-cyclic-nucleotide 2'-phosphodiesterase (5'-nucleotidase family)